MARSGIKEVLQTFYVENSIPNTLKGKEYSRSLRTFLISTSFTALILADILKSSPLVKVTTKSDFSEIASKSHRVAGDGMEVESKDNFNLETFIHLYQKSAQTCYQGKKKPS